MSTNFWELLGIEQTTDTALIRQAYREKLPSYHPETDPDGFKALREAYESAISYAKSPETAVDTTTQQSEKESVSQLTEEQIQANEIYNAYQALLEDPQRCYKVDEWQKFIGSFYDYPMSVIDSVKWRLLTLSYETTNISESCVKILADNLRWRQQLMTQFTDDFQIYDSYLNHIDHGDLFDYTCLPTTNKALQNATIDYIYSIKWVYWERRPDDVYIFLSQDTVFYLPDDKKLMLEFAFWHSEANMKNQFILDYALKCIAENDQDEQTIIDWKYIAAIQYTLLEDKHNALQFWLDLYYSGHYQEKAESWIAGWCVYFEKDYFPLLIMALNNSHCIDTDKTEIYLHTIPQLTTTTTARLAGIDDIESYPKEIVDFVNWALSVNWSYRQVLSILLRDDGSHRLYRLYRHAVMLRHGNEILLQEILDEQSNDPFEQFILHHLKRQARQHLTWLKQLSPIQEFKAWLFDDDKNALLPKKFDPDEEGELVLYGRLWLDRFQDLPEVAKLHLYHSFHYSNMEMFDWAMYLQFMKYYLLPEPPNASTKMNNKNAYWQWFHHCLLVLATVNQPINVAIYLQQENNNFTIKDDDKLKPLIEIFKHGNWQNETELYNLIDNDSKLINCILNNYPDSMEWFIDDPDYIDFNDFEQKIEQLWTPKLAKKNPVYVILLYLIVLNKPEQKAKLDQTLQKLVGDNKDLKKIANSLKDNWSFPLSVNKNRYHYTKQVDEITSLAERLSNQYSVCDDDELKMLDKFKNDSDNDLVLRLCAALLLAKNTENQKWLESQSLPQNKWWQFWRWNGRTNIQGFIVQLILSITMLMFLDKNNFDNITNYVILTLVVINTLFAIKRRINDTDKGQPLYFIATIFLLPLLLSPCWLPELKKINRYGPPIEKKTKEK